MEGIEVKVTTDSGSTLGKMQCYGISRKKPFSCTRLQRRPSRLQKRPKQETPHQPTIVFLEGFERPIPGSALFGTETPAVNQHTFANRRLNILLDYVWPPELFAVVTPEYETSSSDDDSEEASDIDHAST